MENFQSVAGTSSWDWVGMGYTNSTSGANNATRDPSFGKFGSKWLIPYTCAFNDSDTHQWCMAAGTVVNGGTNFYPTTVHVDTTALSGTLRDWSPSWVKNPDGTVYLDGSSCPHIMFTSTNGTTSFGLAEMHPTNNCSDPSQGGTTWSTPVNVTVSGDATGHELDPYTMCINTSLSGGNCNGTGDVFYTWYINLTLNTTEFLQYCSSSTLTGTCTQVSNGTDWMGLGGTTQEGPMVICADRPFVAPCSRWRVFYDAVVGTPGDLTTGQINYTDSTNSWSTWSAPTPLVTGPQAKHGTVIPYP